MAARLPPGMEICNSSVATHPITNNRQSQINMVAVTRLNHAVLYVRELKRSVEFYQALLGFVEVARMGGRMAFLRAENSLNHHDLGLAALGANAPSPPPGSVGLYHLAWEVSTMEDLAKIAEVLREKGYLRGASDHGASKSVYGEDPDGNQFEITWMVPREAWGEFEDKAVVEPLNWQRELQRYGSHPSKVAPSS